MSWTARYTGLAVGRKEDLDPNAIMGQDKDDPLVREQFDAAAEAAYRIIQSRAAGDESNTFSVNLAGHANPGHAPQKGYASDSVTVSVSQENE